MKNVVAIIGCGHWGPNYIRNFQEMEGGWIVKCCDSDPRKVEKVSRRFPGVEKCSSLQEVLGDARVGMAVVATPASSHHDIIRDLLARKIDVLAEKPLTVDPGQSAALAKVAEECGAVLMVAHTFIYNSGIRKVKELIDSGRLGRVYYLNATRTHMGLLREDVNVVWDLAPHDVSIFNYLLGCSPLSVTATAACHLKPGREDVAFINLRYPGDVIANIHVSWEDSNKERTVRVVGSKARIVFDDIAGLERVKIFEKGIGVPDVPANFGEFQLSLRDGDIFSPRVDSAEPLRTMCVHFIDCVRNRSRPMTDAMAGYEVVKVMAGIDRSIQTGGPVLF